MRGVEILGFLNICEILVAIVFGLENPSFFGKNYIFIPKCTKGGPPVQKKILKKHFFTASLI